jgi:hypothetical protein
MPLSVVDLYRDILPKTNCGDCGFPTCMAFAGMVVSEKHPLSKCPHLPHSLIEKCKRELDEQYAMDKWTKRDMARDALEWAKERSTSMKIQDLPDRIGGKLIKRDSDYALELPYLKDSVIITKNNILKKDGSELTRWEQVFIYNHIAQGGSTIPTGKWKGLIEIPNTISKIKSMAEHVETPLKKRFKGKLDELSAISNFLGGTDMTAELSSADSAFLFKVLPRVPVMLMFWDEDSDEGFEAQAKLLFDETVCEHLDIESMMFLSERLCQLLCETVTP